DGIRDLIVTGVQTCALPISSGWPARSNRMARVEVVPWSRANSLGSAIYLLPSPPGATPGSLGPIKHVFIRAAQCARRGSCARRRSEERRVGKVWREGGTQEQ